MLWGKFIFEAPNSTLFLGVLRGFGGVDDLKKAEMAKALKNGLIMIEMNPLNHNWSHFVILSGLTLHQFQKKLLLRLFQHFLVFDAEPESERSAQFLEHNTF